MGEESKKVDVSREVFTWDGLGTHMIPRALICVNKRTAPQCVPATKTHFSEAGIWGTRLPYFRPRPPSRGC